jgi:hypothetical protein
MNYDADWAGYDNDGNDRRGHMHIHPEGTFYRADLVRGFYCCARLTVAGQCTDPPPQLLDLLNKETD